MNKRQFRFNIGVSLSICALGALISQIDAAGAGLLTVGSMLTLLNLLTVFGAKLSAKRQPKQHYRSLVNAQFSFLSDRQSASLQKVGQTQCK